MGEKEAIASKNEVAEYAKVKDLLANLIAEDNDSVAGSKAVRDFSSEMFASEADSAGAGFAKEITAFTKDMLCLVIIFRISKYNNVGLICALESAAPPGDLENE